MAHVLPIDGFLYFIEGTPTKYQASGSAVEGNGLLEFELKCPTGTTTGLSDAKPWLVMNSLMDIPPPGNVLDGTYVPGDGNVYTWHFELQ